MKFQILPLLVLSAASFAFGQDTTSDAPKPQQRLDLFEGSLYGVEPFLDAALLLSAENYEAILAAKSAYRSNPELSEAKAAVASASGEEKTALNQKRKAVQKAAQDVFTAAVGANLSAEGKTLLESLNLQAKEQKKRALKDAGLAGLTEHDPQFEEVKKKASELERQYLVEVIAATLSEPQKSAIQNARSEQAP